MTDEHNIQHLAMIMDGNRRWATERRLPKLLGHTEGAKNLRQVAIAVRERGIPYLTLYTLSTENLKNRGQEELRHLFSLLNQLPEYLKDFQKYQTRLNVIGDLSGLPANSRETLQTLMKQTAEHTGMTLTLAINYGGRDEITRAVKKLVAKKAAITEETITSHLDTYNLPDVDLVIRTAGDQRLSNFLPWQTTYAELYFTPVKWPTFGEKDLDASLAWFAEQKRNRGK